MLKSVPGNIKRASGQPKRSATVDLDDTTVNTFGRVLELHLERGGNPIRREDVTDMHLKGRLLRRGRELSKNEISELFIEAWVDLTKVRMMHERTTAVINRMSQSFEIHFVTCTTGNHENVLQFLNKHILFDKITFATTTDEKLHRIGDIHIDDHPSIALAAARKGSKSIIHHSTYMGALDLRTPNLFLAKDWPHIELMLNTWNFSDRRSLIS
jgi:hypothetical protein